MRGHQHDRQPGEVLHEADQALRQLDDDQQPAAARAAGRGAPTRAQRDHSATDRPISRNTASACNWETVSGSRPVRGGLLVAGVRAAAGHDQCRRTSTAARRTR